MSIEMSCPSCAQKYRLKDSLAGKKAKCAKCGAAIQVPAHEPPDELEPIPDLGDLLDDPFPTAEAPLPHHSPLTSESAAPALSNSYRTAGSANDLLKGVLLASAGALVGSGIWVAIAIVTDYEIGWIAWGLGALAGFGMAYGHGDSGDGTMASITAAALSLLGILVAKGMLYHHYCNQFASMGALDEVEEAFVESFTFASMFSPIDGLFILLAVSTAYKIGSGGVET